MELSPISSSGSQADPAEISRIDADFPNPGKVQSPVLSKSTERSPSLEKLVNPDPPKSLEKSEKSLEPDGTKLSEPSPVEKNETNNSSSVGTVLEIDENKPTNETETAVRNSETEEILKDENINSLRTKESNGNKGEIEAKEAAKSEEQNKGAEAGSTVENTSRIESKTEMKKLEDIEQTDKTVLEPEKSKMPLKEEQPAGARQKSPSPGSDKGVDIIPIEERRLVLKKQREMRVIAFKEDEKTLMGVLEKQKQAYMEDPSQHPDYSREWSFFWRNKTAELRAKGLRESDYDMKPEWIIKWTGFFEADFVNRLKREREILMRKHKLLPRDLIEFENKPVEDDNISLSSVSDKETTTSPLQVIRQSPVTVLRHNPSRPSAVQRSPERSTSPWEDDLPPTRAPEKRLSSPVKTPELKKRRMDTGQWPDRYNSRSSVERTREISPNPWKRSTNRSPPSQRHQSPGGHSRQFNDIYDDRYKRSSPDRAFSGRDRDFRSQGAHESRYIDRREETRSRPRSPRSPFSKRAAVLHGSGRRSPFSEQSRDPYESSRHSKERFSGGRSPYSHRSDAGRSSRASHPDRRSDESTNEVSVISTLRLMSALDQAGFIRDLGRQVDEQLGKAIVLENRALGGSWDMINDKDAYKLFVATKKRVETLIHSGTVSESENKVCRIILDNLIIIMQRSSLVIEDLIEKPAEVLDDQRLIKMAIAKTIDQQLTAEGRRLSQQEFNALVEAEYIRVKHQLPSQIATNAPKQPFQPSPQTSEPSSRSRNPWSYEHVQPYPYDNRPFSAFSNPPISNPPPMSMPSSNSSASDPYLQRMGGVNPPAPVPNMANMNLGARPGSVHSDLGSVKSPEPGPSAASALNIDWNGLSNILKTVKGPSQDPPQPAVNLGNPPPGYPNMPIGIPQMPPGNPQVDTRNSAIQPQDPQMPSEPEEEEFYADFTDEELISLLRNFKTLEPLEQKDLIAHMKKLEREEPERVLRLKEAVHKR